MATTKRPVNLKFKNATKVINNTEQQFQEDVTFDKDVDVTGDLAVTGSFTFAGPPPVWVLAPLTLSNTLTMDGAGALGNITSNNGNITATNGNLVATNGDVLVPAGNVTITTGNFGTTTGNVAVGTGNVTVGTGNVAITTAGSFSSLLGDLDLTEGDVNVTLGDVAVDTGNVTVATGDVAVTTGNIETVTGNVEVGTGNVAITTAGNFTTLLGDFESTEGDITLAQGNISVLNTVPGTDGNISCDGAVTVGTTVELLSQGAAVAPVAAGGTLTDVAGELFWKTAAQERQITHATAYFFRDSTKVVGGGAGAACTVAVGNGHIVSFQGTLTAFDTVAGTYAFADIQGAATAAGGVAALLDTSCTVHVDNIGLAGAPAVGVAGGNVTIVLQADPANATHFHADIRVCDVVALIP